MPVYTDTGGLRYTGGIVMIRSIGAVLAGIVAGVALTIGTDMAMAAKGVFPPVGHTMTDAPLLLATAYRIVYSIIGSHITARLAANWPMRHALAGGFIGLVVGIVGIVVTWNQGLGPRWYPIAVAAIALPCAWVGGKLREWQLRQRTATEEIAR
jgi:hypothetical protein